MDIELGSPQLRKDLGEISSRLQDAKIEDPKNLRGDDVSAYHGQKEDENIKHITKGEFEMLY